MSAITIYLESAPSWTQHDKGIWKFEGDPKEISKLNYPFHRLKKSRHLDKQESRSVNGHPFLLKMGYEEFWTKNPTNDMEKYFVVEVSPVGLSLQDIKKYSKQVTRYQLAEKNPYHWTVSHLYNQVIKELQEKYPKKEDPRKKRGRPKKVQKEACPEQSEKLAAPDDKPHSEASEKVPETPSNPEK